MKEGKTMIKVTLNFFEKGVWLENSMVFRNRKQAQQFIGEKVNKPFIKITFEEI